MKFHGALKREQDIVVVVVVAAVVVVVVVAAAVVEVMPATVAEVVDIAYSKEVANGHTAGDSFQFAGKYSAHPPTYLC